MFRQVDEFHIFDVTNAKKWKVFYITVYYTVNGNFIVENEEGFKWCSAVGILREIEKIYNDIRFDIKKVRNYKSLIRYLLSDITKKLGRIDSMTYDKRFVRFLIETFGLKEFLVYFTMKEI